MAGEVLAMKQTGGGKTKYQQVLLHPVEKRFIFLTDGLYQASAGHPAVPAVPVYSRGTRQLTMQTTS